MVVLFSGDLSLWHEKPLINSTDSVMGFFPLGKGTLMRCLVLILYIDFTACQGQEKNESLRKGGQCLKRFILSWILLLSFSQELSSHSGSLCNNCGYTADLYRGRRSEGQTCRETTIPLSPL